MLNATALANAATTIVAAVYVICRFLAVLMPDFLFSIGQSWVHTVRLDAMRMTATLPMGGFFLGLIAAAAITWLATYAFAELYNMWAKGSK